MNHLQAKEKNIFQFQCIPPAFLKLVICVGILLFITAPLIAIYVIKYEPSLKVPAIIAGALVAVLLVVLKEKWKDRYQFKITSASLIVQINGKFPPIELAYSQIERFSLSPSVDGLGNQVSKLSLIDSDSKTVFSIKILNQSDQVWKLLNAWQQAFPVEMKVLNKNGILHAVEMFGELLGGFDKSTPTARIDFINPAHAN